MKTKKVLLAVLALGTFDSLTAADITGNWKSEFDTQIGRLKYVYELKADGEKLTGKAIREREGEKKIEIPIKDGKIIGDDVSFVETATFKFQDQEVEIEYKGRLTGDEIKFVRKVGDFATTEIVAKRIKADGSTATAPKVAGKWQAEFDTQIGKQKYTYDFKVDGDKLTGRATGDIAGEKSDTEITQGRVDGAAISFVENAKFQGQDVRVEYMGKVAGDEIKFTRKVANVATEKMVARRVR